MGYKTGKNIKYQTMFVFIELSSFMATLEVAVATANKLLTDKEQKHIRRWRTATTFSLLLFLFRLLCRFPQTLGARCKFLIPLIKLCIE